MSWEVINARLEDWSATYNGPKFHAVLCDPPYGLEFMGKEWDAPHKATSTPRPGNLGGFADGTKPSFARQKNHLKKLAVIYESWGAALLPHLLPGALVLMFGGTRTWHYLAVGMEQAGFEMWDTLLWLHGQGFPKAQAIDKLIDGKNGDERGAVVGTSSGPNHSRYEGERYAETRQTKFGAVQDQPLKTSPGSDVSEPWAGHKTAALKPAWEPVLCFKAPTGGRTYAELATEFGSGALNVDGGRIPVQEGDDSRLGGKGDWGTEAAARNVYEGGYAGRRVGSSELGRYPANLALDEEAAVMLDQQSGDLSSGTSPKRRNSDKTNGIYGDFAGQECVMYRDGNSGGASRFFYCPKADREERDIGLEGLPKRMLRWSSGDQNPGSFQAEGTDKYARNHHPTVKPIDLCRWLATLILPPDNVKRRLLVPFSGSGSEIIGALRAGWDEVVGVEQDEAYCDIARRRIVGDNPLFNQQATGETNGNREHETSS